MIMRAAVCCVLLKRLCLCGMVALACGELTGCAGPAETTSPPTTGIGDPSAAWPFWPTQMRITPLTRLTTDAPTGMQILETRVEFLDSQGVTTRAVGAIRFELLDAAQPVNDQPPLQQKEQTLHDAATNQKYFDVVTRTYLFRLEILPDRWPAEPLLRAVFTSSNGQVMEATRRIRPR